MTELDTTKLIDFVRSEASLATRVKYVCLLLMSLAMAGIVGTLLATEPDLTGRTRIAFGAMILISVSWAGLSGWVLRIRRPMFARDRVVAGWLALIAASGFGATAIAIVVTRSPDLTGQAVATALLLIVLAAVRLRSAQRWQASLRSRLSQLEMTAM